MRFPSRSFAPLAALTLALVVAACDTAEERAEGHYQRGMEFIAAGEPDRAAVEFRNVFRLNGNHNEARLAYAGLLRDQGDLAGAYSQYLRLVEQDPNNAEGRRETGALALELGDFEAARSHVEAAYALIPEDTQVRAMKATLDYASGSRPAAVEMARAVLAEDPSQVAAHMIVIADRVNGGDFQGALPLIETALAQAPEEEGLHLVKLSVLENLGDSAAMGEQLKLMVDLFPENPNFRQALIRWHLREGDAESAEQILRTVAAAAPEDPDAAMAVVRFLLDTRGAEAARAELENLAAARANPVPFRRALAVLAFSEGDTEGGVAGLRALIEETEPSDDRRDTQVALAQMLGQTGDAAGRDALVDAVLTEDGGHVEALKLRARRHIDADRPELAIQDMRTALEQAPRDPESLTLMAEAHEREGARELAGERLALAVEAANRAPAESLRYARFLMQDDRLGPAESVVVDALRLAPQNRDLLLMLGQIHLQRRDWTRANQVAGVLRGLGDQAADQMADSLEATALRSQNRLDETIDLLRSMVAADNQNLRAVAGLVQTYVQAGDIEGAQAYVGEQLAADPTSIPLRMMQAGLHAVTDEPAAAEEIYRAIIAERPDYAQPYRTLFALLLAQGREAEAEAVLDQGIAALPEDAALAFTKASLLETRNDFDGAIAIYEALYARDSSSEVIANNLASLITTHRTDAESLERAFAIARRLRNSEIPHFQDTYGWILHRRGDSEQALAYLEPAAEGLPDNALVQYHLGMAYAALERWDEARAALERAIAVAGPDSPLPQIAEARTRLAEIAALPAEDEAPEADPPAN